MPLMSCVTEGPVTRHTVDSRKVSADLKVVTSQPPANKLTSIVHRNIFSIGTHLRNMQPGKTAVPLRGH